jgi:parvulin-like peptidyl-prolyl isomerase
MTRKEAPSKASAHAPKVNPWKRRIALAASAVAVVGLAVMLRYLTATTAEAQLPNPFRGNEPSNEAAPAAQQASAELPRVERPKHDVMAVVNGQDIRRAALATACVERYGEEVLEGLVNKRLIQHHCRNRGIQVTEAEIEAEIDRMAKRFKISREQLLKDVIERERGVSEAQYKNDMLWPMIAIRKVAAEELTVSEQQLTEAYESQFGAAVQCRLLVVRDRTLAEQLQRQLTSQPEEFARLAMQHSEDVNSASIGGLIQPIRRHVGDKAIEQEVFALEPNQISKIIPVNEQFAILKCEGRLPARNLPLESVRDQLIEQIKESKLRDVASTLFQELQSSATVQNVWNNPQLREQMPGVVATINGEQIPYAELAEACLLRYGERVLDVEISHLLLQQALASASLTVTEADLNAEMSHAAQLSGVVDKQGRPDLAKWIQTATEEQRVSKDQYIRDSVWPSAALKKLTSGAIEITPDDMKKAFEANYSERVRCRAIVLPNMRKAQEVWAKARQNPSPDYFGDLAEEYSIEPTTKSLRGEVPPIRRFGGQPQLEDVAFELQPGELSGIIQLGDKFAILKCEGRTDPIEVNPQDVQQILHEDLYEKKLRMAMGEKFDELRARARIDNFLAGTSQAPDRVKPNTTTEAPRVDTAVQPAAAPPR